MNTGPRSTEQWREHRALLEAIQRGGVTEATHGGPPPVANETERQDNASAPVERYATIALAILALLWVAAVLTSFQAGAGPVAALAQGISLTSGPLALIGIAYLLLRRTSRREAQRFGRTSAAMRTEAVSLEATVARLATQIDDSRRAVAEHGQQLLALGEDSTLRLAEIAASMRRETANLTEQAQQLEGATATALGDMGVLIADLPGVEAQVHDLTKRLREASEQANERASILSGTMETLTGRAREVDEVAGGAAQRLSAHLARIDSISDAAGSRIDAAAAGIARTVDTALTNAADAVDATRASLDGQSNALLEMVERSKSAFDAAGADAGTALEDRIGTAVAKLEELNQRLVAHDDGGRSIASMLDDRITEFDRAMTDAHAQGTHRIEQLADRLHAVTSETIALNERIAAGGDAASALVSRGEQLDTIVARCVAALEQRLPGLIAGVEADAERSGRAIDALLPRADALATGLAGSGTTIDRIDVMLNAQQAALNDLGGNAADQLIQLEERARAVEEALIGAGRTASDLTERAGPKLVEALLRVRETAAQAATHANHAFADVIREAAERLGEESRRALEAQVGENVEARLDAIAAASEQAVATAQEASRRLQAEVDAISSAAATLETRITGAPTPAGSGDGVSMRVNQLIEHLNATTIDVTKLLSSDVPDTVWAAYLEGDRGAFTRQATRLVAAAEGGEIARLYQQVPAFREQADRYIQDFEGMMRHILSARDGSLLGVTLLSSDMGKLYVTVAQGIERLRA